MTRAQFLNDLYRRLAGSGMKADQAEQHLTYYAEMLADRMEEGMVEEQAVASMEDVDTIARRILEEEGLPYRSPEETAAPPEYPDASQLGGGGGTRGYQVPKRRRIAQIALWALAIVLALGAVSRWVWGRNVRRYHNPEFVDSVAVPVDEVTPVTEAPYAEWDESYAWDMPYMEGYEYTGGPTIIDGGTVNSIDIQWASGTVLVQSWSGSDIQIQEYAFSELDGRTSYCVELEAEGCELSVRYREGAGLGNLKGIKWLTVLVPDGLLTELDIETTSANVQLNGLELGEIDVSTTSGEIQLTDCYARTVEAESVSGEVNIAGLHADELDVSTTSGCVNGNVNCGDIEASTISGDIWLDAMEDARQVRMSSTSGDLQANVSDASLQSIAANTASGDVTLGLPWDIGFTLDFSTVSGDLSNNGFDTVTQNGKVVYNGGGCGIEVNTVSGNLELY